jgi:hypothetical protein
MTEHASTEAGTEHRQESDDRTPPGATLRRWAGRAIDTRGAAEAAGIVSLVGGLRALRRGKRVRGLAGIGAGALLLRTAATRRRARGEGAPDQRDVVPGPDLDAADLGREGETGAGSGAGASTETDLEEADVVDRSPDLEDLDERETPHADVEREGDVDETDVVRTGIDVDAAASASIEDRYERVGAAAIDGQSHRVPAPQRAFNRGYLSSGAQAHWGVRETDGAVAVSGDWDSIQDAEEIRYVASTEIEADGRRMRVPDEVLDHWDEGGCGGTAVSGGDELVFLTAEGLKEGGQLWVVPEEMAGELPEEG